MTVGIVEGQHVLGTGEACACDEDLTTFLARDVHVAGHLVEVALLDERPNERARVLGSAIVSSVPKTLATRPSTGSCTTPTCAKPPAKACACPKPWPVKGSLLN